MKKVLITGAFGQIGSELTTKLRGLYGDSNVVATDIKEKKQLDGPFEIVDVTNRQQIYDVAKKYNVDTIMHRSEEHTSELQSRGHLVCRLLLEKKKKYEVKMQ